MRLPKRPHSARRGFTLVEMLVVVLVIGILGVLSAAGYRRMNASARTSEATQMISAIKVAQEAVKAEAGAYLSISSKLCVNANDTTRGTSSTVCYPPGAGLAGLKAVSWSGWGNAAWDQLGVQSTGTVKFGYSTIAGRAGEAVPTSATFSINGTDVTWPTGAQLNASPWYIIGASADQDGDGTFGSVVSTSWNPSLMFDREGD